ncbi:ESX secretion-associated protein EspG [Actinophytocola sp.]|uniref:ESX secretion-associated protein EspG n=1 Tax=Actinophytocola sp. TaxID=1872138 RepID=UPI002ED7E326
MPRPALDLSTVELDVVWRAERFGELPLIIDVPSPGRTHAERAELERRVWAELERRELADDHGRASWRLADLLAVIARRRMSLQLRVFGQDATRAILATRGSTAVLAELTDRFRLGRVADTGLAATLLSRLPAVPAGEGYSVNVAATAFTEAAQNPTRGVAVLRRHGLTSDDARTLLAMTTGTLRTAQLAVEWRELGGRSGRSPIVSTHDTPAGRYRTIRTGDHLTITPTTPAALADALDQLAAHAR